MLTNSLDNDNLNLMGSNTELNPEVRAYLSMLGKIGGSKTSEKKKRSSRLNGKKGGRPIKDKNQIKTEPI